MSSNLTVRSCDGATISYSCQGDGTALVLVEPAGHYRHHSAFDALVPLLTASFTVVTYDRRGRGRSSDVSPYDPAREVDDLDALIGAIGRSAYLYGFSSGGLVALHAAAAGLPIAGLVVLEPPLDIDRASTADPLTGELAALVTEGRYEEAVAHFHRAIGVPDDMIDDIRGSEGWKKMVGIAPTLVYDCRISERTDRATLAAIDVPTLILDSAGSSDDLTGSAAILAANVRNSRHKSLPGTWHGVAPELIAAELKSFFMSIAPETSSASRGDVG